MIFQRLEIHNLFSYQGVCTFDLAPPAEADGRNVVLIWGRNGYGKTSFINSLKLALAGVTDDLRAGVHVGRNFKRDHYLLGMADEWMGVFNRQARAAGEKTFGVTLEWIEPAGTVTLQRIWKLEGKSVTERLDLTPSFGEKPTTDIDNILEGESRAFVQERLPAALLPFFIYDAERVQQLAEANREGQMQQIEQLLDLANIDVISEYLGKNLATWRRESGDANQHQINAQRLELQALDAQRMGLQQEKSDAEDDLASLAARIDRADVALQARRQFALQTEAAGLTVNRTLVGNQLEEKSQRFFTVLTREAPLVLNADWMQQASAELNKIVKHPNRRLNDELSKVLEALPQRLLRDPPRIPLSPEQIEALERKLGKIIRSYQPDSEDMTEGLFHLSPTRAEELLQTVGTYAADARVAQQWASDLLEIRRLKTELKDVERKLNDVSNLAPDERAQFEQKAAERVQLESSRGELQRRIGAVDEQINILSRNYGIKQDALRQAERALNEAQVAQGKLGLGQKLQKALEIYRDLLKGRRRGEIEAAINTRFRDLMTSHGLIHHIRVNEDFSLHYEDAQGASIGMGNISAGMKQLVAQALLWGLKDVANRDAPVVVDTPLARIDRQHQNNLITRYFPHAGRQVIVLPTDSELDREKYALIRPYVYREYRLENQAGDATQVQDGGYY
ncbi:DNA sulfur modification protein DndD [Polaromonas sp.]|uniref:DNA sulfur modification protein DndD n=1 Tax=Polaromonas sp. TaxID=1869339 RepID=UPI003BB5BD9B